jgi:hypothetical protein
MYFKGGREGTGLCGEELYTVYSSDLEPTKLLYHPKLKTKNLGGRGPQTDKHMPPSLLTGQFLRKADI